MGRFRFLSGDILVDAYVGGEEACCLSLLGFPASQGENSFTKWATDQACTVLQPHYPGTYDSGGVFTPKSAIECVRAVQKTVALGSVADLKSAQNRAVPTTIRYAMGYSFGAFVALRALRYLPETEILLLVSPAITYGAADLPSGFIEKGPAFLDYVRRSRPHTYRLGSQTEWEEFYAGGLNVPGAHQRVPGALREVIGIVGGRDKSFDLTVLGRNFESIVRGFAGDSCSVDLSIVPEGSHSISTLFPIGMELGPEGS